jgi:hypothetical protein
MCWEEEIRQNHFDLLGRDMDSFSTSTQKAVDAAGNDGCKVANVVSV